MGEARAQGVRAHVGLLVGEARAQGVLGLVLSHQWAEPSPEVIGCRALGSRLVGPLIGGARFWSLY